MCFDATATPATPRAKSGWRGPERPQLLPPSQSAGSSHVAPHHDRPARRRRVLTTADRYRYAPITTRGSATWPNGTGLAVYLAMGIEAYRFGEGRTEDIIPGVAPPDLVNASWRDYGNRVGAFRLLDRTIELGVPCSVLLNAAVREEAPDLERRLREAGCETVAHGISNSDILSGMEEREERRYVSETRDRLAHAGSAPLGWSSMWLAHTERTIDLL